MFDWLISSAYAQNAAAQGPQAQLMQLVPFLMVGFIFYFLMIKPQKKRLQEEQVMLKSLQKGDEVFTKSGIIGTIFGITEKVITLEVSEGTRIKVLRSQVGGLAKKLFEKTEKTEKK